MATKHLHLNPSYSYINDGYHIAHFSGYWLGLYKSFETKSWRWIDESSLTYFNWGVNQPDDFKSVEHFAMDVYEISQKNHTGWNDWKMLGFNIVLCELKC